MIEAIDNYSIPGETMAEFWQWWRDQCRTSDSRLASARQAQPISQRFKAPEPRKEKSKSKRSKNRVTR